MVMESYYPPQALALNQGWAEQAPPSCQPPGYHRCSAHLLQGGTHAWLKHKHPRITSFPAHPCTGTHQGQDLHPPLSLCAKGRRALCPAVPQQQRWWAAVPALLSSPSTAGSRWPTQDLWLQGGGRTSRSPGSGSRAGGRTAFKGNSAQCRV